MASSVTKLQTKRLNIKWYQNETIVLFANAVDLSVMGNMFYEVIELSPCVQSILSMLFLI